MDDGKRIIPIGENDLVRDIDGQIIGYKGPSFRLVFDKDRDLRDEIWDLTRLGYYVGPIVQNNGTKELVVHGEIPLWAKNQYRQAGVKVTQTKERESATM